MKRLLRHVVEVGSLSLALALLSAGCDCTKTTVVREEKGFKLVLVQNTNGAALSCALSKGVRPDEDHVRWVNQTGGPVKITFTLQWPFLEEHTAMTFTVPAGQSSPYYTLNPTTPGGAYDYTTDPTLVTPGGGHGEPTISVGD